MNVFQTRPVAFVTLMGIITTYLYIFVDHVATLAVLSAMLLTMPLYYIYQTQRLQRVLDSPAYDEIPSVLGLWGEVYYRLRRLVKG